VVDAMIFFVGFLEVKEQKSVIISDRFEPSWRLVTVVNTPN